jgi:NAD-dependent dihydropyrimidine dehydrogenase PreA subunit
MRLRHGPSWLRDTLLRFLPHRAPTGLIRIGQPGRDAPVLLTCNFTLTVRRLREVLAGRDVWLLVANSRGINVWCAAGGGHLTHHDVISVLRTSGIAGEVDHRKVMLPMLAATGVEASEVKRAAGWRVRWGPARLEELPACLDARGKVTSAQRQMTFPAWERLEMGIAWSTWLVGIGLPVTALAGGWQAGVATAAASLAAVTVAFALVKSVPLTGGARWLTGAGLLVVAGAVAAGLLLGLDAATLRPLVVTAVGLLIVVSTLVTDVAGTTPHLPSALNAWAKAAARVEVEPERCKGDALCTRVCPHEVLEMVDRRVEVARPDACIVCAACVRQCPTDALRLRFPDGHLIEAGEARGARLDLLGRPRAGPGGQAPST